MIINSLIYNSLIEHMSEAFLCIYDVFHDLKNMKKNWKNHVKEYYLGIGPSFILTQ